MKRTLYFSSPAYLHTAHEQMVIELSAPGRGNTKDITTTPVEDIGVVILDHQQITLSQALISKLMQNNVALITCDSAHYPVALMLPLEGHSLQSRSFRAQLEASEPLKKQLWQQTVAAKINNQAALLGMQQPSGRLFGVPDKLLSALAREVKSGDSENTEAKAAVYYWKNLFPGCPGFTRDRCGYAPNNLLNYGYAILRTVVARALTGSGLLPTIGIHHHNQYNAFCLADDIMEPYRPWVDKIVCDIVQAQPLADDITLESKKQLLGLPAVLVTMEQQSCPLANAVQRTTASLKRCFEGETRKLIYPELG